MKELRGCMQGCFLLLLLWLFVALVMLFSPDWRTSGIILLLVWPLEIAAYYYYFFFHDKA